MLFILTVFSLLQILFLLWQKFIVAVFLSKLDHRPLISYNILQGYSSVGIGFNTNNKHDILPIVYTMLV